MLNILKNLEAAEKGEAKVEKSANNSMKMILESIDAVEGCGDIPPSAPPAPPEPEKVRMNVNLNAEGTDAIADLLKLMGGNNSADVAPIPGGASFDLDNDGADDMEFTVPMSGPKDSMSEPTDSYDDHDDMKKLIALSSDMNMEDEDVEEEWDNAPDETYDDHDKMVNDLSGGLNRKKKQYAKAQDGDNAMAVEQTIKEQLLQALAEKKQSPAGGPACWDGKKIGNPKTKMKDGKRVNNCIDADGSDGK